MGEIFYLPGDFSGLNLTFPVPAPADCAAMATSFSTSKLYSKISNTGLEFLLIWRAP